MDDDQRATIRAALLAAGSVPPAIVDWGDARTALEYATAEGWTSGYEAALADLERLGLLRAPGDE